MKKIFLLLIFVMVGVGVSYYVKFVNLKNEYNYLNNMKKEYVLLSKDIDKYKKYSDSYKLVVNDGLSLEEKLKNIQNDVNSKSERVSYYKNSISNLNSKMR